ncbi:MAG: hypothetical protein M9963_06995 [Kiritimatiellae bacterium]|nr:hypothetical protein [Kiritimatiellia bacterium]
MSDRLSLRLAAVALAAGLFMGLSGPVFAHGDHGDHAAAKADAGVSAAAIAAYPLNVCVVSDEPLASGDGDEPVNYVYKSEGQPDRLVRLCCKRCLKKFQANPEKYLKLIDDAAAAKSK